jgi:hypothetical protein
MSRSLAEFLNLKRAKCCCLTRPVLDELSLPAASACALGMPCPDLLTPQRAAAAIWSWAPGHPFASPAGTLADREYGGAAGRLLQAWQWLRRLAWDAAAAQVLGSRHNVVPASAHIPMRPFHAASHAAEEAQQMIRS